MIQGLSNTKWTLLSNCQRHFYPSGKISPNLVTLVHTGPYDFIKLLATNFHDFTQIFFFVISLLLMERINHFSRRVQVWWICPWNFHSVYGAGIWTHDLQRSELESPSITRAPNLFIKLTQLKVTRCNV